jgi:hypothetical protein
MDFRRYYFFWFLSIVLVVGTLTYVFWPPKNVTEEEAQVLATEEFHRRGQGSYFDVTRFAGPRPTRPPIGIPYGFEWTYKDREGEVKFYVWVEKHGTTWSNFDGNLERLRSVPEAAAPPSAP